MKNGCPKRIKEKIAGGKNPLWAALVSPGCMMAHVTSLDMKSWPLILWAQINLSPTSSAQYKVGIRKICKIFTETCVHEV